MEERDGSTSGDCGRRDDLSLGQRGPEHLADRPARSRLGVQGVLPVGSVGAYAPLEPASSTIAGLRIGDVGTSTTETSPGRGRGRVVLTLRTCSRTNHALQHL
jgi:hypothetical protein